MIHAIDKLWASINTQRIEGDRMGRPSFRSFEEMKINFDEWDKNADMLRELEKEAASRELNWTVAGAATGAAIGSFIPVLGTLVGGLIGGVIGVSKGAAEAAKLKDEIDSMREKLKDTFEEIKEFLGLSISELADGLSKAFDEASYAGFVNSFAKHLENQTRDALITAFLASETMYPLMEGLSDAITLAVWED